LLQVYWYFFLSFEIYPDLIVPAPVSFRILASSLSDSCLFVQIVQKKSLKIPKGHQRTDNTMDERNNDKKTNNDLQNTTQKTKDRATRTLLKTGGELRCSGRVRSKVCGP
jgi:hypothetical protein